MSKDESTPIAHASPGGGMAELRHREILLKAGALQNAIFNSANFSSIATDANGVIQIFNVGAERMLGYAAVDVMNKITPADISDPQEVIARAEALSIEFATPIAPGFQALIFKASRGIEDIYELTYIRKDGSRFPAVVSITALRDAQDDVIGYLLIGTDNTARKQAEEALSRAGALQNAIFNSANFSSIATDANGVIQIFNVGAERMLGYAAADVMNKITPADISDPDEVVARAEALSAEFGRVIAPGFEALIFKASRGIEDIYELTYIREDGSRFPAVVSVTALRDAQNAVIGYLLIGTDNTARNLVELERKKLDQALRQANVDLERAMIAAEKANLAKSEFLAAMSHEIRTPMNGVIGMIDVLQQSNLKPKQMEMADIIHESAFALLAVINDILDFSKIEAGKLDIDCVPLSVADVIENVCQVMNVVARKNKVELTLFTDPTIPEVLLGDPGRLRQIVTNLVSNAVKFSSKQKRRGRVSVRAVLVTRDAEHVQLKVQVADNGIGINGDTLPRIFTAFIQADHSTTRKFGGTGLGLTISRQLANIMGGEITVVSELGKGSLFVACLPFALPAQSHDAGQKPACLSALMPDRQFIAGLPCLVIGDADGVGDDLAVYLAHDEATVERVADLAAALQWLTGCDAERAVVVIDSEAAGPLLDGLRGAARTYPQRQIRYVIVGRVGRKEQLPVDHDLVMLEGNLLTRGALLKAVATAAGRSRQAAPENLLDREPPASRMLSAHDRAVRRSRRILVAEDYEINQKVILRQLGILGFDADVIGNGRDALQCWRNGHYAMLLTDLHMPEMDGFGLTAAIRREENPDHRMPVIVVTANALKEVEVLCKQAGMDDYLSKPVLLHRLKAMLEKWLPPAQANAITRKSPALPTSGPLALLDTSVLALMVGNDPAVIADFMKEFRHSANTTAQEIRGAISLGDWKKAGTGAHRLKSSCRAVGAMILAEACERLESACMSADTDTILALAGDFENAMADILVVIH